MDINEIKTRIRMNEFCIRILENDQSGDPRKADALDHYRGQLSELQRMFVEANKPPDIVVHLKAAQLSAISPK